jgi:hypothetical protein
VAITSDRQPLLLLGLAGGDGLVHGVVDAEDLGQPGDPEDLEDPLLGADQVERPVVRADTLQSADKNTQAGRVEELDSFHIHDKVVIVLVDQVDQQLPEPWCGVYVDLAFNIDDLDAVLGVVTQLQFHEILQRRTVVVGASRSCRAAQRTRDSG